VRRHIWPSDCAQIVRSIRLHVGIQQQALAGAVRKKKGWLAKRELGLARMTVTEGKDLMLAIITMCRAETVEKNRAKMAVLQKSDKGPEGQVVKESVG
jgi:hypothetical protein